MAVVTDSRQQGNSYTAAQREETSAEGSFAQLSSGPRNLFQELVSTAREVAKGIGRDAGDLASELFGVDPGPQRVVPSLTTRIGDEKALEIVVEAKDAFVANPLVRGPERQEDVDFSKGDLSSYLFPSDSIARGMAQAENLETTYPKLTPARGGGEMMDGSHTVLPLGQFADAAAAAPISTPLWPESTSRSSGATIGQIGLDRSETKSKAA